MLSDNKNIQEQTNSLGNSFKNIASMTNPNKEIPKKSNYGKLTPQEKQSEYIISRYPNGIINIHDGLGGFCELPISIQSNIIGKSKC